MPPKPVRIGLTKKPTIEDASEVEDEFDNTVPPLSVSVMTALEDIVDVPIDIVTLTMMNHQKTCLVMNWIETKIRIMNNLVHQIKQMLKAKAKAKASHRSNNQH